MNTRKTLISLFASALLLGSALTPALAVDLNLGGGDTPGASAIVTLGGSDSTASATIGNTTGQGNLGVTIANTDGSPVDVISDGKTTKGDVNLGGLTGLVPIVGGGALLPGPNPKPGPKPDPNPGPGGDGGGLITIGGTVSPAEKAALRVRCTSVLEKPFLYDSELVRLCQLAARLKPLG